MFYETPERPMTAPEGRFPAEQYDAAAHEKAEVEVGRTKVWDEWFADEKCDPHGPVSDWVSACVDYQLATDPDDITDALCRKSERWERVVDAYIEFRKADAMFEVSVLRGMAESGEDDEF